MALVIAVVHVRSLAQELPHAMGEASSPPHPQKRTFKIFERDHHKKSVKSVFDCRTCVLWGVSKNCVLQNSFWETSPYRLDLQLRHFSGRWVRVNVWSWISRRWWYSGAGDSYNDKNTTAGQGGHRRGGERAEDKYPPHTSPGSGPAPLKCHFMSWGSQTSLRASSARSPGGNLVQDLENSLPPKETGAQEKCQSPGAGAEDCIVFPFHFFFFF